MPLLTFEQDYLGGEVFYGILLVCLTAATLFFWVTRKG